jgi:hypothetical protein
MRFSVREVVFCKGNCINSIGVDYIDMMMW